MASGGGSSKFTVQTVVVRRNSRMSMGRGRSLVDSRGSGGEDERLVDVGCGERSRTRNFYLQTLQHKPRPPRS